MAESSPLQRAARGSILNVSGAAVSAVANFALAIVVAWMASEDEAGLFFAATSFFLLAAAVGQLGTNTGLVYFISGARTTGRLSWASAYMRIAAGPVLAASLVMAALTLALANPLADVLASEGADEFAAYLTGMAFFLPCAAVFNLALAGTRGLGTMTANAGLDQVARPVLQLALVVGALALVGADQLAWIWTAAYLPLAALAWWSWRRLRTGAAPDQVDPPEPLGGAFWRFTSPRALAGVSQVAMQRLDIVLVAALAGAASAAIYTAATRFMVLGQAAARAVSMSVQPLLGEALAGEDREDARALYQSSTGWLVLVSWPLYLTLIVFGPVILDLAFPAGYADEGADALLILCATMLVATSCGMVDMVLTMSGRSLLNLTNVLVALGVYVTVDVILIPRIGLVGAAIGWSAGILAANLLPLSQVRLAIGLHPFGRGTLTAIAMAAVVFGAIPFALTSLWSDSLGVLLASLALSVVLYAIAIWRWSSAVKVGVLLAALRRRGRRKAGSAAVVAAPVDWASRPPTGPRVR